MIEHITTLRVRYAETDQMGYVYYGNYFTYYEVGRVELIRHVGVTYKTLEENGIMLPVLEARCKYIRPARYDDYLTLKTCIKEKPAIRITFDYELYSDANELLNIGKTTLVFVNSKTMKPCPIPQLLQEVMFPYFDKEK